ncbi:MAG TPA: dienelactone hydrolase family protein [Xanthobacteraceae bacterium]|jgi:carboxymethylenebutenolidase|nr:dienelactone hydrolase family protein [Xanthobacteraceae bacterium]
MGRSISLTSADGFELGGYRADPADRSRGGVVVVQEIFGVNTHIRSVCDRFAALGYTAVAPSLFDRFARNFQSGYSPDEIAEARKLMANIDWTKLLDDTGAGVDALRSIGPVAVIGFCMGGSVAFLAAARIEGLAASIAFYGGQIARHGDERPHCPVQMHFGEKDEGIPMSDVTTIRGKRPDCEIYTYPAGHGFYCDQRASFHAESAMIAWGRSLEFLERGMKKAKR